MMDKYKIWLVPEDEQEEKKYYEIEDKLTDRTPLSVAYHSVKELLKMDYITLGKEPSGEKGICGAVIFGKHILTDELFKREVILNNEYFKPFFKYLTRNMKMQKYTWINFYYEADKPVIVTIEGKKGIIAPYIGDLA
jgi:hypothetical protein